MKFRKLITLSAILLLTGLTIAEDTGEVQKDEPGNTYVMIVGGINKDPEERQAKDKAVINLRKSLLNDAEIDKDNLKVLVAENSFAKRGSELSDAVNVRKVLTDIAATVKPNDKFIFYYTGQANVVVSKLRLNLPGPDMTHQELKKLLSKIKTEQMLIVLDCPISGFALKDLTAPGIINI
jgi:hypothetical protein